LRLVEFERQRKPISTDAAVNSGSVFITSSAATVTGDFVERIVIETFRKVCARQLRCGTVRLESPQPIDIGRIAAIAACGVDAVSAD